MMSNANSSWRQTRWQRPPRRGFTLLEVLVSIALVLIIILGVNQVFALTSQAVGAGNAVSTIVRDARSAQSIITEDLGNAEILRAPFFLIQSEVLLAFRNRADQLADIDYSPANTNRAQVEASVLSVDRDRNGRENDAGDSASRAFLTTRTHRADILKFFTRQTGRRQTGNAGSYTSGISSSEQYVVYGHLRQPSLPDNLQTGRLPGIGPSGTVLRPIGGSSASAPTDGSDNPNNFYATQWILGRNAFLLRDPEVVGSNRIIREPAGGPSTSATNATYYGRGASGYQPNNNSGAPFTESSQATTDGSSLIGTELIQYSIYDLIGVPMERYRSEFLPNYILIGGRQTTWTNAFAYRHTGYPAPSRPLSSQGVARTVPCFIPACTQFVVEYAGDFVTQDPNTGAVTAVADATGAGTDTLIDYNVVTDNSVTRRVIRWYGFPRDVNSDGRIIAAADVVPLRDFLSTQMLFERNVPARATDYGNLQGVAANAIYRCAWGPDTAGLPAPKMIRILMAIDDPAARVANEQFFEFIVELP